VSVKGLVCHENRLYTLKKLSVTFNSKLTKLPEINKQYAKVALSRLHCLINT